MCRLLVHCIYYWLLGIPFGMSLVKFEDITFLTVTLLETISIWRFEDRVAAICQGLLISQEFPSKANEPPRTKGSAVATTMHILRELALYDGWMDG